MKVKLPRRLKSFVKRMVDEGAYADPAAVVCDSLRRMNASRNSRLSKSFDFRDGDVMALVLMVMMQCSRTNAQILHDLVAELQKANKDKKVRRFLLSLRERNESRH